MCTLPMRKCREMDCRLAVGGKLVACDVDTTLDAFFYDSGTRIPFAPLACDMRRVVTSFTGLLTKTEAVEENVVHNSPWTGTAIVV